MEKQPRDRARWLMGRLMIVAVPLAAAVMAAHTARIYYEYPQTDDAYVRADTVGIAAHVSGPIIQLPITDDQHVRKGDLLMVVDPRPYQAALQLAQAQLDLTNLEIDAYSHALGSAKAREAQVAAQSAYDRQYLNRIVPLLSDNFVTADQVSNARSKLAASQAAVADARSEVARAQSELGDFGAINVRRQAAEATLYDARLNVEYCYVRAPFDGYVSDLNIAVGQYANVGRQVVSLVDDRHWYVMANFRETFLRHIEPGMSAQVFLLSYPNKRFRGKVVGVGWALFQNNGATIQGLANVTPTLNWVRLAQRFPVRVELEDSDPGSPFRMGATAVVTILGYR